MLESVTYSRDGNNIKVSVLDQLLLPKKTEYVEISNVELAWQVIRKMQIRGAPLIAVVAALGLAVEFTADTKTVAELKSVEADSEKVLSVLEKNLEYLKTSRPTAVNLFNAMEELLAKAKEAIMVDDGQTPGQRLIDCVVAYAEMCLARDISDNKSIGRHGADCILEGKEDSVKLLTICNTGSLATAGFGTALGVVREINNRGKLDTIAALETRPYNQGSRLTAYEITEEKMNGLLVCDSMAAPLMKIKGVDACVVGADRISANGDTANKIGTYNLSIIAAAHNVPFYVAAPFTTIDLNLSSGDDIPIEERPAEELLNSSVAPDGMKCWNPAFDVTPARLITGIITEKGVIHRSADGTIDVASFVKSCMEGLPNTLAPPVPEKYIEQTVDSLPLYLNKYAPEAMNALGATSFVDLDCKEVGDGNLNLVFIVINTLNDKKIIVKQSLPYVRCVGESWPLTVERSYFENEALVTEKECCPAHVPTVYHFSKVNGMMVMEYLAPPNIILRKGLIAGIKYPTMAKDMGVFCAHTLFKTSGFKLSTTQLREKVAFWSRNSEMCSLTEQVIFTEPYVTASNNRWTSPQLDDDKKLIENDVDLKLAASKLKTKFVTQTDALLHADLHTGSIMCSPAEGQTFVIDPEFAFYGPMGFDTGAFIANMILSYVSQPGHKNGSDYPDWVLDQVIEFWTTFSQEFLKLWDDSSEHSGFKYHRELIGESDSATQKSYMQQLLMDTLGFAGMKMLRRIVGIAHVEDLDSIEDADLRATCERRGLEIAKELIKNSLKYDSMEATIKMVKEKSS